METVWDLPPKKKSAGSQLSPSQPRRLYQKGANKHPTPKKATDVEWLPSPSTYKRELELSKKASYRGRLVLSHSPARVEWLVGTSWILEYELPTLQSTSLDKCRFRGSLFRTTLSFTSSFTVTYRMYCSIYRQLRWIIFVANSATRSHVFQHETTPHWPNCCLSWILSLVQRHTGLLTLDAFTKSKGVFLYELQLHVPIHTEQWRKTLLYFGYTFCGPTIGLSGKL